MELNTHALFAAAVHLYTWQHYGGDNFHSILFRLIAKADALSVNALRKGFPYEVSVYYEWFNSETPETFYKKYGL